MMTEIMLAKLGFLFLFYVPLQVLGVELIRYQKVNPFHI
jgi:hypothetical protein